MERVAAMGWIGPRGAKHNSMNRQPARSRRAGRRPDGPHGWQNPWTCSRRQNL